MLFRKILALLVTASLIGFCGCPPINNTVIITYEEDADFSEFDTPNDSGGLPIKTFASGLFVAYKIDSIQNTAAGATNFTFDPTLFYDNTSPESHLVGGPLAPYSAPSRVVPPGTVASSVGRIILDVQGDPNSIKNDNNHLFYHTPSGESVILTRNTVPKQFLDPGMPSNLP